MLNGVIGNSPMIQLDYEINNKKKKIYAKLEYYNITGSIKDRVAYYIIKNAKNKKLLRDNMPIIEATSGNTGIALSALGTYYNHPVLIYMPDWASKERIKLMQNYGAKVILISKEEGGYIKCIQEAKKLTKEMNAFLANQFENQDNYLAHYETTGKEILEQIPEKVSAFVSGVGTGGTLMGIGRKLKKEYKNFKVIALEPDKMQLISNGKNRENHKIEGIAGAFVPALLDREIIDDIELVNDDDAINMSRKLAKELGLGVGISSGANILGCVLHQNKCDEPVVTVFADDNKKYLSTELSCEIQNNSDFISNKIKLLGYKPICKNKIWGSQRELNP